MTNERAVRLSIEANQSLVSDLTDIFLKTTDSFSKGILDIRINELNLASGKLIEMLDQINKGVKNGETETT